MAGVFSGDKTVINIASWTDFKKLIDGTLLAASYNYDERSNLYRVVTEPIGGLRREIVINKDGGAAQTEFEASFKNVVRNTLESKAPQLFRPENIPTFYATAVAIATANNKSMLSLATTNDAYLIRIFGVHIVNVRNSSTTGVVANFNLLRCTSHSGGTAVATETADTADTITGVTLLTGASIAGESANLIRGVEWSTDEWGTGVLDSETYDHAPQTLMSILPKYNERQKPLTLRSGQGLTVKCVTNTTTGQFNIHVVFGVERV